MRDATGDVDHKRRVAKLMTREDLLGCDLNHGKRTHDGGESSMNFSAE